MHAWAEVCHLLQSSKSPLTGFYALLAEESQAFFKCSPHTNSISNSAILRNNNISLLSDLCACIHVKKKWRHKGSHSSSVSGSNRLVRLQTWKKRWAGALLSGKAAVLCENQHERGTQIWINPSEEEERKTFWLSGNFLVQYFSDAF